jgi:hypothetical protein
MAKKKPQRDSSNPSTTVVLFLVFFVLLSIGVGVWGYYGYAGQEKLRADAKAKTADADSAKLGRKYYQLIRDEVLVALGHTFNADELNSWTTARPDLLREDGSLNDAGPFAKEPDKEAMKKIFDDLQADLGKFDPVGKKYGGTYREKLKKVSDELRTAKGDLATAQAEYKKTKADYDKQQDREKAFWAAADAKIKDGNAKAFAEATARTEAFEVQAKRTDDAMKALAKQADDFEIEKKQLLAKIRRLTADVTRLTQDQGAGVVASATPGVTPHALMLDLSPGRPLWDLPVGKITAVYQKDRQVQINLGEKHGVRTQLTFNVFGAGWDGRAEKAFKGTIEVIQVQMNSSLARITSQYDETGREIPLNDPVRGRLQREAENALKEGDVLYNLAWGTHVAIVGHVNWSVYTTENPVEQMRNLQTSIALMQRQGIVVDAYVDLTDGTIKGDLTSKTRYVIRGELPLMHDKQADRVKLVHEAAQALRKDAIEKGVFIISGDNFATVIGYRRPRSLNDFEKSSEFRPTMPFVGTGGGNVVRTGNGEPREEPKAKEKEPEKEKMEKEKEDK